MLLIFAVIDDWLFVETCDKLWLFSGCDLRERCVCPRV